VAPRTQYARRGDISIAYQVVGDGPIDLVLVQFDDRGRHELKGVPGHWHLYAVAADRPSDRRSVQSVDHQAAALTPGPREAMRPIDRAAVSMAAHAPGVSRLGFRMARRWRTRG
jgi:hypothetical protein